MSDLSLLPPGLVVNTMKGDAAEHRAGGWLSWNGSLELDCAIVGVPYDGASVVRTGSRHGPDAVRQGLMYFTTYSSHDKKSMSDLRVADIGDVPVVLTDMPETFSRISAAVHALASRGIIPIMIGGDHSIAFPDMCGIMDTLPEGEKLGVIHFDAHHDLREAHLGAESSGVPFRKALERMDTRVHGANIVQIGMAEFTNSPQLEEYAQEQGITVISAMEVQQTGISQAVCKAIEIAGAGTAGIFLSVDIDVLNLAYAPGTAAPNPFGLSAMDLQLALRMIGASGKVLGADLVEISPPYDQNNLTGSVGASLLLSLLYGIAMSKNLLH